MIAVIVEPEAEQDIASAYEWYERQRIGLGDRFLAAVRDSLERLQANPRGYPHVERGVRRALLRTFPYVLLYRDQPDRLVVVACFHGKRSPATWKRRM